MGQRRRRPRLEQARPRARPGVPPSGDSGQERLGALWCLIPQRRRGVPKAETACVEFLPSPLFSRTDPGNRCVTAVVPDAENLLCIGLCMLQGVHLSVDLAMTVGIGHAGLTYTATLLRLTPHFKDWGTEGLLHPVLLLG